MAISIEVDSTEIEKALGKLEARLRDMSPVFDDIGAGLVAEINLAFRGSRDPWGAAWAPLKHRDGKPLQDTKRLQESVTHSADRDGVAVGTNIEYATTHQFGAHRGQYGQTKHGAPIPWGDVPARPFMPIRDDSVELPATWEREILDALADWIDKAT